MHEEPKEAGKPKDHDSGLRGILERLSHEGQAASLPAAVQEVVGAWADGQLGDRPPGTDHFLAVGRDAVLNDIRCLPYDPKKTIAERLASLRLVLVYAVLLALVEDQVAQLSHLKQLVLEPVDHPMPGLTPRREWCAKLWIRTLGGLLYSSKYGRQLSEDERTNILHLAYMKVERAIGRKKYWSGTVHFKKWSVLALGTAALDYLRVEGRYHRRYVLYGLVPPGPWEA